VSVLSNRLQHPLLLRTGRILLMTLVLLLVGLLLRPIESPAWKLVKAGQPEMNLEDIEGALGQGLVVGVLGGFRTIMADFLWIRVYTIWERRERASMNAMIRLVTILDPRPDFFWINSARMIAYDVPNWRISQEGGYREVPQSRQAVIDLEQAQQAFTLLERAREFHPKNPKIALEVAQIYLNRLKDVEHAAEWFLKASEMPGAPYYAARIYAELLRRLDRNAEAYDFLKQLFTSLPDTPMAQKGVILERIRELEATLQVPDLLRFMPLEKVSRHIEEDSFIDNFTEGGAPENIGQEHHAHDEQTH